LTVLYAIAVFLELTALDSGSDEKAFMGWFRPRGLASFVFALTVPGINLPGGRTYALTEFAMLSYHPF